MSPAVQSRPDVEVFQEIAVIEHFMRMAIQRHLPPGMTYAHYEALQHMVREGDGQTPVQLANAMLMSKAAMTNVLQKMEQAGWIAVLADTSDRRKKRIRITRSGLDAHAGVLRAFRWKSDALRSAFTEAEFRDALPFLKALRVFLEDISVATDAPAVAFHR